MHVLRLGAFVLSLAVAVASLPAQSDTGAAAFRQACLDATTDALVLNVAAHPDDEADRTLTVLRRGRGIRTVTVYTTYGSGGQNAIGREIGDDLARIRVRETLAAAADTGVEVRWLGFRDFGFSKSADEAFLKWGGEDAVVGRLEVLLDELHPDVVLTNHAPDRGHGHHRASAIAIRAALRARGGTLYQRIWGYEGGDDAAVPDWECDPFAWDPVRGETFAAIASHGRHQHRTQGPWRPHDPLQIGLDRWQKVLPEAADDPKPLESHLGSVLESPAFRAVWTARGGDVAELGRALAAFATERAPSAHVAAARALLPALRQARTALPDSADGHDAARRLDRRLDALQRVVVFGSGVGVEVWLPEPRLVLGETGRVDVLVHATDEARVDGLAVHCRGVEGKPIDGEAGHRLARAVEFPVPVPDSSARALEPTWIDVHVGLQIDGMPVQLERRVAADVVPPLEVSWDRGSLLVPAGVAVDRVASLSVRRAASRDLAAEVSLSAPDGVVAESWPERLTLTDEHPATRVLVHLHAAAGAPGKGVLVARVGGSQAELPWVRADVHVDPALRVGLVRGPDDTLQQALEDLGVPVVVLDEAALAEDDLSDVSTVVLDIRAYHHRPDLADHRDRLLRFAQNGGRVVIFYHKPGEWNARDGRPLLAPRALQIGNGRVADENATVTRLIPGHRLWNWPHHIEAADFEGWVQERGLNFASQWDDAWLPLIEMHDPGEPPQRGALLWTPYVDGDFVYCALSLYRQLRDGHAGAARLLLNLLTP